MFTSPGVVLFIAHFQLYRAPKETIKKFVSFILKGVDLIDHTSIFLLRAINQFYVVIDST